MQKELLEKIRQQFTFDKRISNIEEYFKAAVLVPLIEIDEELHILFEKRAKSITQGGEICFPGGQIDSTDDSSMHAAIRETQEELGCHQDQIDILGRLDTLIQPSGALIHPYIGVLNESLEGLAVQSDEVAAVFTIPVTFFLESEPERFDCKVLVHPYTVNPVTAEKEELLPVKMLGLPTHYSEPWGNGIQKIYVYPTDYGPIWGLTAQILRDCTGRLKQLLESS